MIVSVPYCSFKVLNLSFTDIKIILNSPPTTKQSQWLLPLLPFLQLVSDTKPLLFNHIAYICEQSRIRDRAGSRGQIFVGQSRQLYVGPFMSHCSWQCPMLMLGFAVRPHFTIWMCVWRQQQEASSLFLVETLALLHWVLTLFWASLLLICRYIYAF